jgi:hypothetical protein
MLDIMRGVVNVEAVFGRLRRNVNSGVDVIDSTPDVQNITNLDVFLVNIALASLPFPSLR